MVLELLSWFLQLMTYRLDNSIAILKLHYSKNLLGSAFNDHTNVASYYFENSKIILPSSRKNIRN